MRVALLTLALLAALQPPASAGFRSGNDLLEDCTSTDPVLFGVCHGYVMAVTDLLQASRGIDCIPDNVTIGQLVDIVVRHLRDRPEARHAGASILTTVAVGSAFPCQ